MKFTFGTILAQDKWNVRMMAICPASLTNRVTVNGFGPDLPRNWWVMVLRDAESAWDIGELITLSPADWGIRIVEDEDLL